MMGAKEACSWRLRWEPEAAKPNYEALEMPSKANADVCDVRVLQMGTIAVCDTMLTMASQLCSSRTPPTTRKTSYGEI